MSLAELAAPTGPLASLRTGWQPGTRVAGTYLLRTAIGRGGMSTVWDAWDSDLRRAVALKTVDDPDDPGELLVNEARALAAVRHPGLPMVHALGNSDGRRFLVLERLYGETLAHRLLPGGAGAMPFAEALDVLVDVADILHAVHQAGMVHFDVKPANIMLCRGHRTVLLDFGVMEPQVGTADGSRAGTPGYVAPEVILQKLTPARARLVDVYAFGVVAYELLTGHPPFGGSDVMSLMQNHVFTPPPEIGALRPDVPPPVGALVRSCLAKDADERPSDMDGLAGELRQLRRRFTVRSPTLPPAMAAAPMPLRATRR